MTDFDDDQDDIPTSWAGVVSNLIAGAVVVALCLICAWVIR